MTMTAKRGLLFIPYCFLPDDMASTNLWLWGIAYTPLARRKLAFSSNFGTLAPPTARFVDKTRNSQKIMNMSGRILRR
jgi:hypothetical protein